MIAARSEELLVGIVALALVPLIAHRIWRGLRDGRLPLYRTTIGRDAGGGRFQLLLILHFLSLVAVAWIALDLLFNLNLWNLL